MNALKASLKRLLRPSIITAVAAPIFAVWIALYSLQMFGCWKVSGIAVFAAPVPACLDAKSLFSSSASSQPKKLR